MFKTYIGERKTMKEIVLPITRTKVQQKLIIINYFIIKQSTGVIYVVYM